MIHFGKVLNASQYTLGRMYHNLVEAADSSVSVVEDEHLFIQRVIDAAFRDYNIPSGHWTSIAPDAPYILTLLTRSRVFSPGNTFGNETFF
jgi:hypothetical protein